MIRDESFCRSKLEEYQLKHPQFCSHYLFESFIQKSKNQEILIQTIMHPSAENKKALDQAFKKHHFYIKFLSYLSKTLYFNAVRFDQKRRQKHNRDLRILDAPVKSDENAQPLIEQLHDNGQDVESSLFSRSSTIDEHLSNESLLRGFHTLTPTQKEILTLYYLYSYKDPEIGKLQNKSQQSVFKTRKQALTKLRKQIKGVK